MTKQDDATNDTPTTIEWLLIECTTNYFQKVMDTSAWIEDLSTSIEKELRSEGGYWGSEHVGLLTIEQLREAAEAFLARGFVTRIGHDVAARMVEERFEGQGCQDCSIDELVGKLFCSDYGFQTFYKASSGCDHLTNHWIRQRSLYLEQTEDRWTFRSPQPFTCMDACSALRDDRTSRVCLDLGCKLEQIGPWVSPTWGVMMPFGWRLVCYRRNF